jgi:uncharacterized iron-regulated protein
MKTKKIVVNTRLGLTVGLKLSQVLIAAKSKGKALIPAGKIALLLLCLLLPGCFGGARHLRVDARDEVMQMMADLRRAQVVFVGEFHDRREHHQLQLEVIRELQSSGIPLAIGLEMFDLEKQAILDEWVRGKLTLQEFVARYQQAWSIGWAEYDAILLFARNNGIPLVALDAPPDLVKAVTYGGPDALGFAAGQRLPQGVTTAISPSYEKFMDDAFRTHAIPDGMFANFCAAQGLRNSTMAKRISGYLQRHPQRTMVVIAGVGHAMRRAVPSAVARPGLTVRIVIPQVEGLYEALDRDDMDYFVTYDD